MGVKGREGYSSVGEYGFVSGEGEKGKEGSLGWDVQVLLFPLRALTETYHTVTTEYKLYRSYSLVRNVAYGLAL